VCENVEWAASPSPAEKPREKPTGSSGYQHRMGLLAALNGPYAEIRSSVLFGVKYQLTRHQQPLLAVALNLGEYRPLVRVDDAR